MDPWPASPVSDVPSVSAGAPTDARLGFEDFFSCGETKTKGIEDGGTVSLRLACEERLPDSVEYLARLEAKLNSLRAGNSSCRQQQQSKEAVIASLLRSESSQVLLHGLVLEEEERVLEETVESNPVLRHICPAQPLTRGETVHLVTADELDRRQQRHEEEESQQQPQEEEKAADQQPQQL